MPQSLASIYLHIVFSTKHRQPLIDDEIAPTLFEYIGGTCRALECQPLLVGGHQDHIHILCKLSRKIAVMKLLEEVKKESSKWIKSKGPAYGSFYWQDGYAAFSVYPKDTDRVYQYIANQKKHHSKKHFQDECRELFKSNKTEYDERYVWD